ncbi:MAG TPA: 50S ribosomal protein L24 [Bacteroidetes bacterium]|jgi:large subunit ribosomal protein L24|nr:50S ribosomal protein L24 [Bacteroidota bacterium]
MHVKKNDVVIVISGNSKGKEGKVLKVIPEKNRVIVEGVNLAKRHTKPSQSNPQGGVVQKEAPIHSSNVMLKDPKTGEKTRIGYSRTKDSVSGKKKVMRVAQKSGEMF